MQRRQWGETTSSAVHHKVIRGAEAGRRAGGGWWQQCSQEAEDTEGDWRGQKNIFVKTFSFMASPNEAIYLSDCSLKVSIQVYWSAKIGDNHYKWFENVCKGSTHSQKVKSKEIGEKIERKKSNLPQAIFSLSKSWYFRGNSLLPRKSDFCNCMVKTNCLVFVLA